MYLLPIQAEFTEFVNDQIYLCSIKRSIVASKRLDESESDDTARRTIAHKIKRLEVKRLRE